MQVDFFRVEYKYKRRYSVEREEIEPQMDDQGISDFNFLIATLR